MNAIFGKALKLCLEVIEKFQNPKIFGTLARVQKAMGYIEDCTKNYERALSLYRQDNIPELTFSLVDRAIFLAETEGILKGLKYWEEALEPSERIGSNLAKAAKYYYMAKMTFQKGDHCQSSTFFKIALEILLPTSITFNLGETGSCDGSR